MRIFATQDYRLSRLPFGARLFYSLFLGMVLLGLLTCVGFVFGKSGISTAAQIEYYRQQSSGFGDKPHLELLETAHFHLFSMPVFFLVLGHIFFLSSLAEIALPWLIVYHSRSWAWLEHPTRIALLGTFLVFVFVPLHEMWTGKTPSEAPPFDGDAAE